MHAVTAITHASEAGSKDGLRVTLVTADRHAPHLLSIRRCSPNFHRSRLLMAYVITDSCIKDLLCVEACPTDCIHPKKDEPAFQTATQLYVDPIGCIDCGACVPVCTSDSIRPIDELPEELKAFAERNAAFYSN
jgi:NAD-dependent dihydropyrimidine dehydrogenase PreA subunit